MSSRFLSLLFFFLVLVPAPLLPESKTEEGQWQRDLRLLISSSQSASVNWHQGGQDYLSASLSLEGQFGRRRKKWDQRHEFKLAYGILKQEETDLHKGQDIIRYDFQLSCFPREDKSLNFAFDFDFNSQMGSGYNYKKNPFSDDDRQPPVQVSGFLAPAFVTQSVNISYKKEQWLTISGGVGIKETLVTRRKLRELYGIGASSWARIQFGLKAKLRFNRDIAENIHLDSKLDFFYSLTPFKKPDIRWISNLDLKVNAWLLIRIESELFYDQNIMEKLQFREVVSITLTLDVLSSGKGEKK